MEVGFILQPTYRMRSGRPVVQLYGRLDSGAPFLVEDDRFRPYFFVRSADAGLLAGERDVELEQTVLRDLAGERVTRVTLPVPALVRPMRDRLAEFGCLALEADIRFPYRYLIDRGVRAEIGIQGESEASEGPLRVFRNPEIRAASCRPSLTTLSLDLETSLDASEIFSAALVGCGVEEVHLVATAPTVGAVIHPDETALLRGLLERIRDLDPDVLLGWNVVDFDLRVLARACERHGIACDLGRAAGGIGFQQDRGFTRQSRADVPGRMVIDGIGLVRDALRLEDYRLETVARHVLGRGKLIDSEAPDAGREILRLYREDPAALVAYNLEDARLVPEILEREGLLALTLERSLVSGMQLDRVGASIASFDLVYLPELRQRGVVAPSVDPERKNELVQGGAVLASKPGLFSGVAVFDFQSLYPSLIRTFNLDPLAHARGADESGALVAPNGARLSREPGILSDVVERYMARRDEAKQRGDRHADQAIKIMMNALFGVLGAASCRFFAPALANAITGFGQQTLSWTRDAFEAIGAEVLYGDTDSVFVKLSRDDDAEASRSEAEALRTRVERRIAERVRDDYGVEPKLVLELERIFERFFLPRVRGGRSGSKKRYAGWSNGRLEIVGLEAVRRDWPAVARRLQEGMLERLFRGSDVMPFVAKQVQRVLAGELDDELVYVKRVRKGSLDRYTATTPPHIQAARKAGGVAGPVIRYVIAHTGPEPVLPGRPLPQPIDHRHYVEKVLRPVADAILPEIGQSFDEAIGEPSQLSLL